MDAHRAIDQQRLRRAADAGAAHFGVEDNLFGHIERGRFVNEDVAYAFKVREYRHPRFGLNARDQALATARHDDVEIAIEPRQHQANGCAVAGRDELNGSLWQIGGAQTFGQGCKNCAA